MPQHYQLYHYHMHFYGNTNRNPQGFICQLLIAHTLTCGSRSIPTHIVTCLSIHFFPLSAPNVFSLFSVPSLEIAAVVARSFYSFPMRQWRKNSLLLLKFGIVAVGVVAALHGNDVAVAVVLLFSSPL